MQWHRSTISLLAGLSVLLVPPTILAKPSTTLSENIQWISDQLGTIYKDDYLKLTSEGSCELEYRARPAADTTNDFYYIETFSLRDIGEVDPSNANDKAVLLYTNDRASVVLSVQRRLSVDNEQQEALAEDEKDGEKNKGKDKQGTSKSSKNTSEADTAAEEDKDGDKKGAKSKRPRRKRWVYYTNFVYFQFKDETIRNEATARLKQAVALYRK